MIQILIFIVWLIDILNIDFIINDVHVAYWLDVTVPLNFWFWLLFWILCPSTTYVVKSKD